jgi:hypothetical protein
VSGNTPSVPSVPGQGTIRADAQADGGPDLSVLEFWNDDFQSFLDTVHSMKPARVHEAADAYNRVAGRMKQTIEALYKHGNTMLENWSGGPAEQARTQLQKLYDSAGEIYSKSAQTGAALKAHAEFQKSWQDAMPRQEPTWMSVASAVTPLGGAVGTNYEGQSLMHEFQQQTVTSNNNFPQDLQTQMPQTGYNQFNPNPTGGAPPGGGLPPGGKVPGGPGGKMPPTGKMPPIGNPPNPVGPHPPLPGPPGNPPGPHPPGPYNPPPLHPGGPPNLGNGTHLAGFNPGHGAGMGPGGLGGASGGGLGPGGGLGGGSPLAGGLTPGLGNAAGAAAEQAAAENAAMGAGRMMPPGGHGGHGEQERERSTWLLEDEDVWGADDGDTAPGMIG